MTAIDCQHGDCEALATKRTEHHFTAAGGGLSCRYTCDEHAEQPVPFTPVLGHVEIHDLPPLCPCGDQPSLCPEHGLVAVADEATP